MSSESFLADKPSLSAVMVVSQPTDSRAATSSPTRPSAAAQAPSRLPVPRARCHAALANKENEQLPALLSLTAVTTASVSKPLSALPTRSQRQPLAALPASDYNGAVANRAETTVVNPDTLTAASAVPVLAPPPPPTRRQWVKSMDVLPVIIPSLLQDSPSSSADSDGSTSSDDGLSSPDRSDVRQPHFNSALTDSPIDVKASTIAALQSAISDMQAQHDAAMADKDAGLRAVMDELQQCKTQLYAAAADTTRLQQQLADSAAQLRAVQLQLAESDAKWRTAHLQHVTESKQRDGEIAGLRRQLAAVNAGLSETREADSTAAAEQTEREQKGEAIRLVLVGDCIKRQRKAAFVG